ncbi:hypothetical protein [Caulobacter sp. 17J65-9]|uniref:hypothetical protein n=1 Tax=Caulobacter sp. 17J65-9 TaxID=2709382 RepID=UPI0013CA1316|nr:hypothetical protein [Caulobacter sp. 17J65-9]NEX91558.1 hypothetical protein [Caulobacter sp. 17J65-9]
MRPSKIARLLALIVPLLMGGMWTVAAIACPLEESGSMPAASAPDDDCAPKGALGGVVQCAVVCHASVLPSGPQIVQTVTFQPVAYAVEQEEASGVVSDPDVPPPRGFQFA